MYAKDWYMRQIELMVQFIAKVFFKKPIVLSSCEDLFDLYGDDIGDDIGGGKGGGKDGDGKRGPDGVEGTEGADGLTPLSEGGASQGRGLEGGSPEGGAPQGDSGSGGGSRTLKLRRELARMIEDGRINEAEDILFENLSEGDRDMLAVAVAFYVRLNQLEDFFLASCAYSREEINEGLKDALGVYGATPDLLFRS